MSLAFNVAEYAARQENVLAKMAEDKLDAVVLFSQESMFWLTGYDTFGYCFFQALIVTKDGRKILLTRSPDLRQAQATSTIEDIILWRDRQNANPALDLREVLVSLDLLGQRIGVEYQANGLNAANGRLVDEQLASFAKIIDISGLIDHLRLIKTPAEIALIRKAANLTDDIYDAALKLIKKGANESDILAVMLKTNFSGDGDFPANEYVIGSGKDALLCRYKAGRRSLAAQDQLTLEWSGVYRHYHAPMMRTIMIGRPSKRHEELYQAALECLLAMEQRIKPQAKFSDVFDAYVEIMEKHDLTRLRFNACGYSIGARFAPSWMEMQQFQADNATVIAENMTFFGHVMLFDSETDTAMTLARSYLVTAQGNEALSRHSLDLIVKS